MIRNLIPNVIRSHANFVIVSAIVGLGVALSSAFAVPRSYAFAPGFRSSGAEYAARDASELPPCYARQRLLAVDNAQVLEWKRTTPNQFLARALVRGTLVFQYSDRSGHGHMRVQIGPQPTDVIEAIYNEDFGELVDPLPIGATVVACGDYITSFQATSQYPASPDGAIIHWLHRSPRPQRHDSGFIAIGGEVYGLGEDRAPRLPSAAGF